MNKFLFLGDPEWWALIILYQLYYNLIFRYSYRGEQYVYWNPNVTHTRGFKWRVGSEHGGIAVSTWMKAHGDSEVFVQDYLDTLKCLNLKSSDTFIRWVYYMFEYYAFEEDYLAPTDKIKKIIMTWFSNNTYFNLWTAK